jgi:hypothetical protein
MLLPRALAVTPVTLETVGTGPTEALLGVLAIAFLITVLIVRELLTAYAEELPPGPKRLSVQAFSRGLGVAVPPLMVIFALVVVLRIVQALH